MSTPSQFTSRALETTVAQPRETASQLRANVAPPVVQSGVGATLPRELPARPADDRLISLNEMGRGRAGGAVVREELPLVQGGQEPSNTPPTLREQQREILVANARALVQQAREPSGGAAVQAQGRDLGSRNLDGNQGLRSPSDLADLRAARDATSSANSLANWLNHNRVEQDSEGRDVANMYRAVADALAAARESLASKQLGRLTANSDGSVTTPGGYRVYNDGDRQWRVEQPDGRQHRIWGDPHVDENNDGHDDWHFDRDATFVLPDGTKIHCDTVKVGEHGGGDVTVSDMLRVMHGDALATMDCKSAGNCVVGEGGRAFDRRTSDGQVFVLGNDHSWKDGATLGDLFDGGGDFIADVDRNNLGAVAASAASVLAGGNPLDVTPVERGVAQTSTNGRRIEGDILSYQELRRYISGLERELSRLQQRQPQFDLGRAVADARIDGQVQDRLQATGAGSDAPSGIERLQRAARG